MASDKLHFDVSTGLKDVLGRELITDDEVAIFELVKNSFDAGATVVQIYFDDNRIVVADNGSGMSFEDLKSKWLFVAYSEKRGGKRGGYRDAVEQTRHYAGSKGIGRFSSDRIGKQITLQSRTKQKNSPVHSLVIDWTSFEEDDKASFESIPVEYTSDQTFSSPIALSEFVSKLTHGTVIEITDLRQKWGRENLKDLKGSLAKLINPFGAKSDDFSIYIIAPDEIQADEKAKERAKKDGHEVVARELVNGKVGNFVFAELQQKTTFIVVEIRDGFLFTTLTDRSERVYQIKEPCPYPLLSNSGFRCEMYYLNRSAKVTFTRRVGLPSIQFGSVFLFRNGFRVYPIGESWDDWFGFDRRKQQGYSRFLGTRELIGRVDVFGTDEDFQEASSRNQGLIQSQAVRQLQECVLDYCLKRLERYVVPVSWVDKGEADADDLSRLLTDPGRARVTAAVANLVDNKEVELLDYSKKLIGLLNERSDQFEEALVGLRAIATKTSDKHLIASIEEAEARFEQLRESESEARRRAEEEHEATKEAQERAKHAEAAADSERRRAHFLEKAVNVDVATILNLHHQVTIYSVDINQQIENLLANTKDDEVIARSKVVSTLEQMSFLNRKVQAITRFAARATFKLDSEKIETNLPQFISDYLNDVASQSGSARLRVSHTNSHPGVTVRFNPIDISIVVDNLISNSRKARASEVKFDIHQKKRGSVSIHVSDNGPGLGAGVDSNRIFEMGYTTTRGSGLGLYHVRQVLGEMGGSIEVDTSANVGVAFDIQISTSSE